jgi:hypothetical protein
MWETAGKEKRKNPEKPGKTMQKAGGRPGIIF